MSDNTLAEVLAHLQGRLRTVENERAKLRKAIEAVAALVEPNRQQTSLLDSESEPGLSGTPTYAEAAQAVLRGMGRPLHIAPLMTAMQERGWFPDKDPGDRNFSNAVYAALDRRADMFVRTGPAMFALREWAGPENETAPAEAGAEQ